MFDIPIRWNVPNAESLPVASAACPSCPGDGQKPPRTLNECYSPTCPAQPDMEPFHRMGEEGKKKLIIFKYINTSRMKRGNAPTPRNDNQKATTKSKSSIKEITQSLVHSFRTKDLCTVCMHGIDVHGSLRTRRFLFHHLPPLFFMIIIHNTRRKQKTK